MIYRQFLSTKFHGLPLRHIRGADTSGVQGLQLNGLERDVVATVDGFDAAVALARGSDLIATVPEKPTAGLRQGMHRFALPTAVEAFTISLR